MESKNGKLLKGCIWEFVGYFVAPALAFWLGWLQGILINWIAGNQLISGFNSLFNATILTHSNIPFVAAMITLVAWFFKQPKMTALTTLVSNKNN